MPTGLESLLEALRKAGVNVDGPPGGGSSDGVGSSSGGSRTGSYGSGSADSGSSRDADAKSTSDSSGGSGTHSPVPNLDLSFLDGIRSWGKRGITIAIIVIVLIALAAYWWFHPPINIHSGGTWGFIVIFVIIPLAIIFFSRYKKYYEGTPKVSKNYKKARTYKWLLLIPAAIAAVGIVGGILSLPLIPGNAERFSNVLKTDTLEFAQDIHEVNYSEIPVIDRDSAILLGNREMGSIPEYVSQFEVSTLYSQINYHQEPVRVSPLNYADLFKWFTNREAGIPAYALVNMTTQDAEIVRLGDSPIFYSQSEPLVRNIDRHVQLSYPFYIFDEISFEIDEDGHPWWICPVRDYTIGLFSGETISRVVLCDATTGECQDLAVEDCPEWVDRVYPAELLLTQYNWWGSYNNGWLNSFLGQEGVVRTTPGSGGSLGYNYIAKDDDVWVYTGVTSATADNSIIGFVLINQRTQESHFYSVPGATEESAMGSAEGQVQNLRYTATFPLLINVANQPTYFMALKDAAGLVKMFAMIDIQRYQNVATGYTVESTQEAYETLLVTNGVEIEGSKAVSSEEKQGTIELMTQAVLNGNSHFYVKLSDDDTIYDFAFPGLVSIVGYTIGDSVHFTYLNTGESPATVESIILPSGEVENAAGSAEQQAAQSGADVPPQGMEATEEEGTIPAGNGT